jgi:hypothetical protein
MSDEIRISILQATVHFEHWFELPGCNQWGGLG